MSVKHEGDQRSMDFHHDTSVIERGGPALPSCTTVSARFQAGRADHVEDLIDSDRRVEQIRQLTHRQPRSTHPRRIPP